MNALTEYPDPFLPLAAVEHVWEKNRELVDKFQLRYRREMPGGVIGESWFVLVKCEALAPDAYELGRALETLQEAVEKESGLNVTLMLSNKPSINGSKKAS